MPKNLPEPKMPKVPQPHEDFGARIALHEALKNTPDITLNIPQAALYLGCHPSKLERWRGLRTPPHPVGMNGDEGGGYEVRYRVGELQNFLRTTMPGFEAAATKVPEDKNVLSQVWKKPSVMKWLDGSVLEAEDIEEPFFVDNRGLFLAHGWEDKVNAIAERLSSPSSRLDFVSWDNALAGVWKDEDRRLSWLAHADTVSPGLRAAVALKRQMRLAKI